MNRTAIVSLFLILFSFSSCTLKADRKNINIHRKYIIGKKSFPKEDELILKGLFLTQNREYDRAAKVFLKLFQKSNKEIYLREAFKLVFHTAKFNSKLANELIKNSLPVLNRSMNLKRMVAVFYLYQDRIKKSKKLALELVKQEKSIQNYNLLALIYKNMGEYQKAYQTFMKGYEIDFNDDSIKQAFDIKYNYLNQKEEAKSLLETHIRIKGCSKDICLFLGKIYRLDNDLEAMSSIYHKLYQKYKDKRYMRYLIDMDIYLRKYDEAIKLLKESGDEEKLMEVYALKSDFLNASKIAEKIYKKKSDIEFLALEVIYKYEHFRKIKDFRGVKELLKKFKKVVTNSDRSEYFNYYGYLLIDHNINIKEGIIYVKKALEQKPDYETYLDSLAWGYYKLGKCKEAMKIMKRIVKENEDDKEILEHYNKIKKCNKEKK